MMRILAGLLVVLVLIGPKAALAQCPRPAALGAPPITRCGNPEFKRCLINVEGIRRYYCLHVPDALRQSEAPPVTIAFHGANDTARSAVDWLDKHTQQGVVLIAPAAMRSTRHCVRSWRHLARDRIPRWAAFDEADGCVDDPGPWPPGSPNRNDLDFVRDLLVEVEKKFKDSKRYAVGFSNGAGFVTQLLITQPLAEKFAGYAMIANGMNKTKRLSQPNGGFDTYTANTDIRRPAMLIWGTSDKYILPAEMMIDELDRLSGMTPPPIGCEPPLNTPEAVIGCLMRGRILPNPNQHAFASRIELTRHWLVRFNNAFPRAIEGLYPDRGHGDGNAEDETMVTRRDYIAKANGEPVSVLTIVNGRHNVPGVNGAHPNCPSGSCDINAIEEIFQFWRANAGFRNLWR